MKVLLLAPNAGVSLSTGGGANFVVKQARAYARMGHDVVLAGFHALPVERLEEIHGVSFEGLRSRLSVVSAGGDRAFRLQRALPGKPSPYLALLDPRVRRWLADLGPRIAPERVWFHDDIPAAAVSWARETRSQLYVHYPLLGRSARVAPPLRGSRGRAESAQDTILRGAGPALVHPRPQEVTRSIWTNSSVTSAVVRTVWGASSRVWSTYVNPPSASTATRSRRVLAVGSIHRGKGLESIVEGFARAAIKGSQLTVIGHARDPDLLSRLRRDGERAAPGVVEVIPDAPRAHLAMEYARSRAILGGARFEPFGLSILEGMAHGATPIVRRSEYSGAWLDLTSVGRFGVGFDDLEELVTVFRRLLAEPTTSPDSAAQERAGTFDEATFETHAREAIA